MVEDLNSIFEDPDKEEVVVLPESEVQQQDVEVEEEVDKEEKELTYQEQFNQIFELEGNSSEFIDPLMDLAKLKGGLDFTLPSGVEMNWGEISMMQKFNRESGLFNVDNFKNDAARASAILFNQRITNQREKFQETLAPFVKVANPGEETSFDDLNTNEVYKWEIGPQGDLLYYYKANSEEEDWILQENKKGALYIQTYFEHNDQDVSDLDDYFLMKDFSNDIYDADEGNKKAVKAIDNGLLAAADSTVLTADLNNNELSLLTVQQLVGVTDNVYIPQDHAIPDKEIKNIIESGDDSLSSQELKAIGYDPENPLEIFSIIYDRENQDKSLEELGINLNSFIGFVEQKGVGGINRILQNYYQSTKETNATYVAGKEDILIKAINGYVNEEVAVNKMYLINNFFKNNLDNPEYIKRIKEINDKLEKGEFDNVLSLDIEKLSMLNWTQFNDFYGFVINDMSKKGGFDSFKEMNSLLDASTIINKYQFNNYIEEQFPAYTNFWKENTQKKIENKNKGEELNSTWGVITDAAGGFGGGIIDRVQGWYQGALHNLSGYAGMAGLNDLENALDQSDEIWQTIQDEKVEAFMNLRSAGIYSGKTASYNGVRYVLTEDGEIYDTRDNLKYVADLSTEEGAEEYEAILNTLENSNETATEYPINNMIVGGSQVIGNLSLDITGAIMSRKAFDKTGITRRYKDILNKKFKFNPATVNMITNYTATAAYYGASGTADGYIENYKLLIENDIDEETAHELAQGVALRQGAWYAATSIFVPSSLYNKVPYAVGGFKTKAKQAVAAYKKGGTKSWNAYWRESFSNFSPTSQNVLSRILDFTQAGFGETLQELGQEYGKKKWINSYINDTVGRKIASENFTSDEIMNTAIYSYIAGGTAGMLGGGSNINTSSKQYLENLLYLGKEPTKLQALLNKMVLGGDISQSLSTQLMSDVTAITNQSFKMPTWIKDQNVLEAAKIMEQIDSLNRQKKEFGGTFKGYDNQIKDLEIDLNLLYASDLDIGNQRIANQIGYEYIEGNTAEVENKIKELKAQDPNANVDYSIGFGAFVTANGKDYALIDTVKSAKRNFFTTGQHEGFHGLLAALVRRDGTAGGRLGSALLKEVKRGIASGKIKLNNNEFGIRFQQYVNDTQLGDNVVLEEIMPLLSEALTRGGVTINETTGSKIGDALRRFAASFGINLGFRNGKDVLNLVRDYNLAVESGRGLSRGLRNLAKDKGSFGIGETSITLEESTGLDRNIDQEVDQRSSKDLETLIEDFKAGDLDVDVEALTTQYQKLGRDALKRWAAQRGVTINLGDPRISEEVTSLLNKEFNSFMRNFDSSKASVSTYMNNIAKRIGPVLVEEGTRKGKQVSQDVLAEKGVSLETTTQPDIDARTQPTGKRAKVFPNSVKVIADNITGEIRGEQIVMLKNDITEAILRVGTDPKKIAQYIVQKTKTKEYRAIIKKALGPFGSEQYIDNVIKLFNNNSFIKSIPVANIKRRFGKLFGIKQIDTVKTKKVENGKTTYFDKQVYSIPAITDNKLRQVRQYFLADEKRHQSLMSLIGEGLAVEAINEISTDQEFMNGLQDRLEFRDSNLTAEQFMAELEFNLDKRNLEDTSLDNVKLSKDTEVDPITTDRYQEIGVIVGDSPKKLLKKEGLTLYSPNSTAGLTDTQKENRNTTTLLSLPEFGLNFFLNTSSFSDYNAIFLKRGKLAELQSLFDKPLTPEFIRDNSEYVKKYATKQKDGSFKIDKTKIPAYGKYFNKSDFDTLKAAETEQKNYAVLDLNKRAAKLKDPKFIKLQNNKIKLLEKLTKNINKSIRGGRKNGTIDPVKFEFWASWLATQTDISKHPVRALAPIKFMSTANLPKKMLGFGLFTGKEFNKAIYNNYVAEHTMPANNVAKAMMVMIYNNTIDTDFQAIKNNYIQGQLTKIDDNRVNDKSIGEDGYKAKLPRDFWNMNNPNVWVRYLLGAPRINLNEYIVYENGKIITVADSLGLPLDKAFQNPNSVNAQNNLLKKVFTNEITIEEARLELKKSEKVNKTSAKQVIINQETLFPLLNKEGNTESTIKAFNDADETRTRARKYSKETKGISVFDFDDTLAFSDSKVLVKMPDGKITKITPAEFAVGAEQLQADGADFDFSEFNKVVNGRKGPLADLALRRQEKFGSGDIFVLTARPQLSAPAIKMFLDGIGLNIPLENITGLENGSPEAKALWVLDKTAQGYNDFYFADDALPNVQAVKNILSQVDVKSKVQQAKSSKEVDLDKEFNVIIEQQSGKEWFKTYSNARAKVEGKKANKFEFFIPPSAEDFVGLMYKILPKGEKGNLAMRWINDNLLDPFNKAEQNVISAKMAVANDFQALRKGLDDIPSNLMDESGYSNFTWSQALRVYIWNMQGDTIPGLSTRDKNSLVKLIENNPSMKVFAEKIAFIQKGKSYPSPRDNWVGGSITSDIIDGIQKVYRKEALAEWQQNVDIIFSEKNMNKLEALYGSNYVVALKNILGRMKRGSNRAFGGNPQVDNVIDWVNNSVGTTMFLNRKSALLQLISNVNYLNWSDNNIIEAGKAFANQPQYWKDVTFLLNSDYLVQRRNGLKINVAESEIAEAAKKGGFKGAVSYLLNKGFVFTRFADSLAIATGGATFYRNRLNKLQTKVNPETGKLYTKKEAEAVAFNDFYKVSEETQQSSRTDRISMQQASGLGRVVLNYANTPMQYARIIKKATKDLLAGRGDWRSNVSKIIYYGAVQNFIFNGLQQALFALAFGEEEEQKKAQSGEDRAKNIGFGMLSSLLRGLGYGGALVDTLISMGREISIKEDGLPSFSEDFAWNLFDFSPTVDTKVRKLRAVRKTFVYNRKEIKRRGFNIENPAYYSLAQVIDAGLNIPLDRALRMTMSLKQISDRETATWQRFALALGWSSWSVGLPYWGTLTTVGNEAKEDAEIVEKYTNDSRKLKDIGYKRIPMTRGKPEGKLNVDFIEVTRPSGDTEYWIIPKMKIK